ncbi:hypothetical protein B4065_3321 [Caldibacillus thermoamylovorans]|uniref:hypothetical protein n=1 Tax=Caldibacillus thermoamylovorans TaxID=35841 RepID=UPI0005A44FB6|nr:hypothetical protein [Caldibacillus thermoamylovorans]KIO62101.1 hypothetical protein B4065_3321 [Caldibacillus thermoamylovorans]
MLTVKELLDEAIKYEEKPLVYYIIHLLQKGKISETDDSNIDFNLADHEEVRRLIEENPLKIEKVRIYSLKKNQKQFMFIFAKSEHEAIEFFVRKFRQKPLNCKEYPLEEEITRENTTKTFREFKKEFIDFPALLGMFERS